MLTFAKLQDLKEQYAEAVKGRKTAEDEETYYMYCDRMEHLSLDIQMIEENIPCPPKFTRKVNSFGQRLDSKGRRVKLPNGKYAR